MNKIILLFLSICIASFSSGQTTENDKLIELGKAYKDFMFRNEPPKDFVKELMTGIPENLQVVTNFIAQTVTTDNDLLKQSFLSLPDSQSLKYIYIVRNINYNIRKEIQVDNNKLIDSLKSAKIPKSELVDSYYSMLFASVGNKIKPFDFSKVDFKLKEYNLSNDTEKGIFFLQCMDHCGKAIWGYMNVVKPPNTEKAYDLVKKFPKFNGLKYYQFTDLHFPDFEMLIVQDKGKQSYKGYYIDKYYDLLINHLTCLNEQGAKENDINDLLLGSILKDRNLYQYTKHQKTLERMFQVQK